MLCNSVSMRHSARRPVTVGGAGAAACPSRPLLLRRAAPACSSRSLVMRHAGEPTGSSSTTPAGSGKGPADGEEEFVGLLPEEDQEIPGNYFDALNRNTKLGKAVAAAVDDIEHLQKMELDSLRQAEDLLKKLGLKGSLFGEAGPAGKGEEVEEKN